MRKLSAIVTILVFVFSISTVYACGDKSEGAKASTASSGSSCASKVKAERVDAGSEAVEASTANYTVETVDLNSHCAGKSEASKASAMKAGAVSGCAAKAEAMKANVMKADANSCCPAKGTATKANVMKADAKNCPATADCPVPCNKETKLDNMKAEKVEKASELTATPQASTVSEISSE